MRNRVKSKIKEYSILSHIFPHLNIIQRRIFRWYRGKNNLSCRGTWTLNVVTIWLAKSFLAVQKRSCNGKRIDRRMLPFFAFHTLRSCDKIKLLNTNYPVLCLILLVSSFFSSMINFARLPEFASRRYCDGNQKRMGSGHPSFTYTTSQVHSIRCKNKLFLPFVCFIFIFSSNNKQ